MKQLVYPEPKKLSTSPYALTRVLADIYGAGNIRAATGLLPEISGGAKGYNESKDFLFTTVDGYELNSLWDEFQETIRILEAQRQILISRLSFDVVIPIESVMQLSGDEFELADEFAQPKGIRAGVPFNMGFSLDFWDLAIRYTFRALGTMTAEQVRNLNNAALEAHQRLEFKVILDRVFDNTNTTATLRGGTVVNVYPFYNNDGTIPPGWKTYSHINTHTHYLTSGNSAVTSANLDSMVDHIHHHGYTARGAQIMLMVNRVESFRIQAFRVSGGARYDFIPKAGISFLGTLVGSQPSDPSGLSSYPGFVGMYGNIAIVEEDYVPAGYMFMWGSGGAQNDRNPVGLRKHENESLRGLKLFPGDRNDYPLINSFYHDAMGSGIRHRGAGVVMLVTSGSYAIPTLSYQGAGGR